MNKKNSDEKTVQLTDDADQTQYRLHKKSNREDAEIITAAYDASDEATELLIDSDEETVFLIDDEEKTALLIDSDEATELLVDAEDKTELLINSAKEDASQISDKPLADSENDNFYKLTEANLGNDISGDSVSSFETPPIDGEEHTEKLLSEGPSAEDLKKKNLYIILGLIAGVLILTAMATLIPMQMNTSEINKSLELGEKYLEEGKYEEAILAFDKVITIDEKNVEAYEGKGASYLGMDNYPEAEVQLETAKSIDFTDNGKVMMADVYINTNRKDQGVILIEEVVKNQPDETKTIILITDLYNQINEYTKIIDLLEKKIAITNNKEELKKLYDELIPAYVKAGKSEAEILALLEKAATATGDQSYVQKKDSYVVKKPAFSLAPGEYQGGQSLEVVKGNPVDKIYYTVDGSSPTIASPEYTTPFNLPVGETMVKIIEVNANGVSCPPLEGKYVITQAKLSDSEFVAALNGGWYNKSLRYMMILSNSHFIIGKVRSGNTDVIMGSYTIESTTHTGGKIIVPSLNGEAPIMFDFGTPGDNRVSVRGANGDWIEFTAAEAVSNGHFLLPGTDLNGSDFITDVYANDF